MKKYIRPAVVKSGKATLVMSMSCREAMSRNCNTN